MPGMERKQRERAGTKNMPELRDLLVEELQDLLHAENQLVRALPKMSKAAHSPKLREGFNKHLDQTQGHVARLNEVFELLGEKPKAKPCKAMAGLIEEGQETIAEGKGKNEYIADLALIAAAQKVEHYEISGYGTARTIARLIREKEVSRLLSQILGEEEATDYLLGEFAKPLMQEVAGEEIGDLEDLDIEDTGDEEDEEEDDEDEQEEEDSLVENKR